VRAARRRFWIRLTQLQARISNPGLASTPIRADDCRIMVIKVGMILLAKAALAIGFGILILALL